MVAAEVDGPRSRSLSDPDLDPDLDVLLMGASFDLDVAPPPGGDALLDVMLATGLIPSTLAL